MASSGSLQQLQLLPVLGQGWGSSAGGLSPEHRGTILPALLPTLGSAQDVSGPKAHVQPLSYQNLQVPLCRASPSKFSKCVPMFRIAPIHVSVQLL